MTTTPYFHNDAVTLYTGDAVEVLGTLPDASAHCVVTSPPYWKLRDYGTAQWIGGNPRCQHQAAADRATCVRCGAGRKDRQYGLEATPQTYVDRLRAVFDELRRILVATGTVWLNLGDSYATGTSGAKHVRDLPRKNLLGMPWRLAFALQRDGWLLRNAIIWHKPNAIPDSVHDRLSNRYEMLFLLTKQQKYHFDLDAIREPLVRPEALDENIVIGGRKGRHGGIDGTVRRRGHTSYGKYTATSPFTTPPGSAMRPTGARHDNTQPRGKNPGDVWSISTRPLRDAHFAAYPIDIPLRCIAAGCPPEGVVLDPFSGAATTGLAARQLDRTYVGIDLNHDFHDIGLRRLGLQPTLPKQAA